MGNITDCYPFSASSDSYAGKNNITVRINVKLYCISAMKEYLNKSMEELRMEDYQANRKYLSVNSMSGSTNLSSAFGKDSRFHCFFLFKQFIQINSFLSV